MRTVPCPLLGHSVGLPDRVERIVSLSPSLTDCVVQLGFRDRLVGRSAWCWRPEAIEELPVVGSYTGVREEVLHRLDPDLILMTSGVQEELARKLARAGEPVYVVPLPTTPWGILENVVIVAVAMGEIEAAEPLVARLSDRLDALRGALTPRNVYVEIDLGGPVTIGEGSYAYWALRWVGLSPLIPRGTAAWSTPPTDWLETIRPEVVIYDPQPRRREDADTVRERFESRGLQRWFENDPAVVVTEGDVIAHYGPWFIGEGFPDLVRRISERNEA
ncbi:MAG TPA: ABC transporter substrate-binding protein [Acidobacteria bacterium]|nr:ABC transporter substrate-binding protein [Acidobacteriota bacterium]